MSERGQVFLSYAKEDAERASRVHTRLQGYGFRIWMDRHDLLPGQEWDQVIRAAIRDSNAFVVLLSPNAVTKTGYIQKEIREALEIAELSPDGAVFIIPVRLSECEVPERLRKWHWVDLFKRGGYGRLKHTLARHVGEPDVASSPPLQALTLFADPLEHFLYNLFQFHGVFWFARLPSGEYALSQGHLMVIRPKLNPVFETLKGRVGDYRRLPLATFGGILSPNAPWRRPEFRVSAVSKATDSHLVMLRSEASVTGVFDYYWQAVALVARHPEMYVTAEHDPIYIELDGRVLMIVMPMRLPDSDRVKPSR